MTTPVRFAILGFGHHASRRLVPAFAKSEHTTLHGIWRRNQAAAAQNCRDLGIPHCFPSAEALCASPEIDAVFITSPDAMHRDDALLAIRHGKAVLCEKPLSMNAAEAEEIVAAAESAGVFFGVAQNFRYNRSLDHIRTRIAAGAIEHSMGSEREVANLEAVILREPEVGGNRNPPPHVGTVRRMSLRRLAALRYIRLCS